MRRFLIWAAMLPAALVGPLLQPGPGAARAGETAVLEQAAAQFRRAVLSGDYRLAYELTSTAYRQAHTIDDLRWNFQKMAEQPGLVALKPLEDESFYEPPLPEEPPDRLGTAYLVVEKILDDYGEAYKELEAFTIVVIREGERPVVDGVQFGRRD